MEDKQKYEVGGRGAVFVLIVLFLLYVLNFADRALMAIVLEPMKKALQLTDAQVGATQSIFLLGVGLLMIPGLNFCGAVEPPQNAGLHGYYLERGHTRYRPRYKIMAPPDSPLRGWHRRSWL